MKRTEKYYKLYFIVDIDYYHPQPIGFHLMELLGYNKNILLEFYKVKDKWYDWNRVRELKYELENSEIKKNIKYLSLEEPYNYEDISSIVDAYGGDVYFYWKPENEKCIKYNKKMSAQKSVELGICKFAGEIVGEILGLYFSPEYYLEHEKEIQATVTKFKELYKYHFGYDPSRGAEV